ncbi:unnamed protein product [Caretta caretta]
MPLFCKGIYVQREVSMIRQWISIYLGRIALSASQHPWETGVHEERRKIQVTSGEHRYSTILYRLVHVEFLAESSP